MQPDSETLWDMSPSAGIILEGGTIVRINRAFRKLLLALHIQESSIVNTADWKNAVFDERNLKKFDNFLSGKKKNIILDLCSNNGDKIYINAVKVLLNDDEKRVLLSFQDITEIREDSQALQAGYDEFIHVTTELEKALAVIEEQKQILEHQKSILENELTIAHHVQEHLLSQNFSKFKILSVSGYYCAMAELGGDMWEFYENNQGLMVVLGDVMGHGVAPSLISIAAKTLFKKKFEEQDSRVETLGEICSQLNNDLLEITNGEYYITVCIIRIELDHTMEYITAGHPPLVVAPADSSIPDNILYTEQPMLGIIPETNYSSLKYKLKPGDRILLYTDCLVESLNPDGKPLEIKNITNLIRYQKNTNPDDAIQNVLGFLKSHSETTELVDDLALVCLEVPFPTSYFSSVGR